MSRRTIAGPIDRLIENADQHGYLLHDADIGVSRVTGYRGSIMFRRLDTIRRAWGLDSDDGPNRHSLRKNFEQAMQPDEEKGSSSRPPSRF